MSRFVLLTTLATVWAVLGNLASVPAQTEPAATPTADNKPLTLPLVYRSPEKRVLFAGSLPGEVELAKRLSLQNKQKLDLIEKFDVTEKNYSKYHLIVGGSNCMVAWETAKDRVAFDPLVQFVANGGHLLLFGTFNGANSEHLQRFGIKTGYVHDYAFRPVPGRTDILFKGHENIVPAGNKMYSTGNFHIEAPHVVLLKRGEKAALEEQPALATMAYKKGRVTFTQVEPMHENNFWLMTILMNWSFRGAPTAADQLDQNFVFDERDLAQQRKFAVPSEAEWKAAEETIRQTLRDEFANTNNPGDKRKLADRLVEMSQTESSPASKFVSLTLARDLYLESPKPTNVFSTLRQLHSQFRIDDADANLKAARKLAESIRDPAGSTELAKECLDLADELAVAERFSDATECATLAKSAAQLAKHRHYQSLILPLTKRLTLLTNETARVKPFRERLIKDNTDLEAKLEVGKFHCLILKDWEYGFALIYEIKDHVFKDYAWVHLSEAEQKELTDPNILEVYGDQWLAQANKVTAGMRPAVQSRARVWYWRALSKMTGAQREKLERKASRILTGKFDLRIAFKNGGDSQLVVSRNRLAWKPRDGSASPSVQVNMQHWNVEASPELRNRGSTRYFPEELNLETAVLVPVRMRGTAKLTSVSPEELVIELKGDDEGEFIIKFGP